MIKNDRNNEKRYEYEEKQEKRVMVMTVRNKKL